MHKAKGATSIVAVPNTLAEVTDAVLTKPNIVETILSVQLRGKDFSPLSQQDFICELLNLWQFQAARIPCNPLIALHAIKDERAFPARFGSNLRLHVRPIALTEGPITTSACNISRTPIPSPPQSFLSPTVSYQCDGTYRVPLCLGSRGEGAAHPLGQWAMKIHYSGATLLVDSGRSKSCNGPAHYLGGGCQIL